MYSIGMTNTIDIAKVAAMSSQHLVQNKWYSWFKWTPRAYGSPGEKNSSGTSGSSCLNDTAGETGPSGFPAHPELFAIGHKGATDSPGSTGKCLFIQIFVSLISIKEYNFHYIE